MELENVPAWLEIPLKYYKNLPRDLRLELYQMVAKDKVDDKTYKLVTTVLQLMQLSNVMLDDVANEVEVRVGQKAIHVEHGVRNVGLWALGLSHYIYKLLAETIMPDERAMKYIQVYNEVGTRSMDCDPTQAKDFEELEKLLEEEKKKTDKDYRDVLKQKLGSYTASFPMALYAVEAVDEVHKALKFLDDDDLLQFGFLLQAEMEFIDFHTEKNGDIEHKSWTILIDLLAKAQRQAGQEFVYPKTKNEAIELFEKHKVYDAYLKQREAGAQSLKCALMSMKMSQLKGGGPPHVFEAKLKILEHCLDYFEMMKYKSSSDSVDLEQKHLSNEEAVAAQEKGNKPKEGSSVLKVKSVDPIAF